jgi:hypothetical protein
MDRNSNEMGLVEYNFEPKIFLLALDSVKPQIKSWFRSPLS